MEPNNEDLTRKLKKDSFYRQQQQRLQHITLNRDLKADDMIKNILEKVANDAKITKFYNNQQSNMINTQNNQVSPNFYSPLPIPQCFSNNSEIPDIYLKIWNSVQNENLMDSCHRDKLYQLLISSNLSNCVLAELWSFVNRTKPGQLTRNELFVMLALVSLAQRNVANPFNELYTITTIPIPYFSEDITKQFHRDPIPTNQTEYYNEDFSYSNESENEFCEFKSASIHNKIDQETSSPNKNLVSTVQSTIKLESMSEDSLTSNQNSDILLEKPRNENIEYPDPELVLAFFDIVEKKDACQNLFTSNDDECDLFKNLNLEDNEEFGDFHSQPTIDWFDHNSAKQNVYSESHEFSIKQKILTSIKQVMHKTFNILAVNHDEESMIEALSSKNGNAFSLDLYEVFQIATRIKSSLTNSTNDFKFNQCNMILDEIFNKWNSIKNLLKKTSINLINIENNDDYDSQQSTTNKIESGEKCVICSTLNPEKSSLWFAGFRYHKSCANFWLNYVNPCLPRNNDYEFMG